MKTYHFTGMSTQDVQVISEALGNLPYKVAAPLVGRLQAQINEQEAAVTEAGQLTQGNDDACAAGQGRYQG